MICVFDGTSKDPLALTDKLREAEEKIGQLEQETEAVFSTVELKIKEHEEKMVNMTSVYDRDIKAEVETLKSSSKTSNTLLWINLILMISVIAIMALALIVRSCCRRDTNPKRLDTAVSYVANEDSLNFSISSVGPGLANGFRKTNNLFPERDHCGSH